MALRYKVMPFDDAHSAAHMRLIARAYANIPEHARPTHDEAFQRRMHDDSNPAGRSLVASAWDGEEEAGMMSMVPARFRTLDGRLLTGYQATALVVDPAVRGGLNRIAYRLSQAVVETVTGREQSFLYAYPNQRSIGITARMGGVLVNSVPTCLFPGIRLSGSIDGVLTGPDGLRWDLKRVRDPVEVRDVIPEDPQGGPPGFIRDRAYFEWRFGGPAAPRYTFVSCQASDPRDSFVIACAEHRMKGFPFTVLVDGYPASFLRHFSTAIRAASVAAGRRGPRVVYVSTNLRSIDVGARERFPRGIAVPERFHPRPMNLLLYPGSLAFEEFGASLAMTGDWLGF